MTGGSAADDVIRKLVYEIGGVTTQADSDGWVDDGGPIPARVLFDVRSMRPFLDEAFSSLEQALQEAQEPCKRVHVDPDSQHLLDAIDRATNRAERYRVEAHTLTEERDAALQRAEKAERALQERNVTLGQVQREQDEALAEAEKWQHVAEGADTERADAESQRDEARAELERYREALDEAYGCFMAGDPDEAFARVRKIRGRQAFSTPNPTEGTE